MELYEMFRQVFEPCMTVAKCHLDRDRFLFAFRSALAVLIGCLLSMLEPVSAPFETAFLVGLTVVIVMETSVGSTILKGGQRALGTIFGVVSGLFVAWFLVEVVESSHLQTILLVLSFPVFVLILQYIRLFPFYARTNYAVLVAVITFGIVLLTSVPLEKSPTVVASARLFETVVGLILTLLSVSCVFPEYDGEKLRSLLANGLLDSAEAIVCLVRLDLTRSGAIEEAVPLVLSEDTLTWQEVEQEAFKQRLNRVQVLQSKSEALSQLTKFEIRIQRRKRSSAPKKLMLFRFYRVDGNAYKEMSSLIRPVVLGAVYNIHKLLHSREAFRVVPELWISELHPKHHFYALLQTSLLLIELERAIRCQQLIDQDRMIADVDLLLDETIIGMRLLLRKSSTLSVFEEHRILPLLLQDVDKVRTISTFLTLSALHRETQVLLEGVRDLILQMGELQKRALLSRFGHELELAMIEQAERQNIVVPIPSDNTREQKDTRQEMTLSQRIAWRDIEDPFVIGLEQRLDLERVLEGCHLELVDAIRTANAPDIT